MPTARCCSTVPRLELRHGLFRRSFQASRGASIKGQPSMKQCTKLNGGFGTLSAMRGPQRLSALWVPSGGIASGQDEDAFGKLIRAGFLRQSHAGIFHMLPLGNRVQDKLEALLDSFMRGLGASRLSMSSITTKGLWERSGRYPQLGPELFNFQDRRATNFMLSPTHEEEVTLLVANSVKSYKELPLRLYQITRKYRDELRPRHGLLRTREFTMKDMYTFDTTRETAMKTYAEVQTAYSAFFKALGLPIVKATASSGDMGGDLSHEYHLLTSFGEDMVMACHECGYATNAELVPASASTTTKGNEAGQDFAEENESKCPGCAGESIAAERALEVGHTFHLGARYSRPLAALINLPDKQQGSSRSVPMQMGCHGIGVSRLIGAMAEHGADSRGLRWPRVVAPHEVVIVHGAELEQEALKLYNEISRGRDGEMVDVILDDRGHTVPWKLKDADLVGYPVIVVFGRAWKEGKRCEIQCRTLNFVEQVPLERVGEKVQSLLQRC